MGWEDMGHPFREYGRFIVLEGPDGSGSTTQQHRLAERIRGLDKRYSVTLTQEPSGGPIGQIIRQVLTKKISIDDPAAIAALFLVDRYEHLPREVYPAIQAGGIVLQDRYWYSSLCYQSTAGIPVEKIIDDHRKLPVPDCVLVYDISTRLAEMRRKGRGEEDEFFDDNSFQAGVISKYRELPNLLPDVPFHFIDAAQSIEDVLEEGIKVLEPVLPYRNIPMLKAL